MIGAGLLTLILVIGKNSFNSAVRIVEYKKNEKEIKKKLELCELKEAAYKIVCSEKVNKVDELMKK
jgi:hypothetical protein